MSMMSRQPGKPRNMPPATAAPLAEEIPDEKCDRCGAIARHLVPVVIAVAHGTGTRKLGELVFCQHHFEGCLPALIASGHVKAF